MINVNGTYGIECSHPERVFADGSFAFRKSTRPIAEPFIGGAFSTASRHWFHLRLTLSGEPARETERNEISGVERCGARARGLSALPHEIPFHPPLPRGRVFSLFADYEAKSSECRTAICLLACDKSILLADVRDTISDPRTFVARSYIQARARDARTNV